MSSLPSMALAWIVVLALGLYATWLLIVLGASTTLSLANAASVSWRIRRAGSQDKQAPAAPNSPTAAPLD
jgi:hypothetical protein